MCAAGFRERLAACAVATSLAAGCGWRDPPAMRAGEAGYAPFLEPGFPFIESTVDARALGDGFPEHNLTPRGIVLALGEETYACFDTDLLRLSVAWHGGFLTPGSIATRSYQEPLAKMGGGETDVARPIGEAIVATGLYPGWSTGAPDLDDPRERGPDPDELGRGPLSRSGFGWEAIEPRGDAALLRYRVAGRAVAERWHRRVVAGRPAIVRQLRIAAGAALSLVAAEVRGASAESRDHAVVFRHGDGAVTVVATGARAGAPRVGVLDGRYAVVSVESSDSERDFHVVSWRGPEASLGELANARRRGGFARAWPVSRPAPRWPEAVVTRGRLGDGDGAHVVDAIELPSPNPWRRNVRPSDIDFFPDGRAVIVTFDGDVYIVSGLDRTLDRVVWKRIGSGFNEPQSVRVRGEEIFVFSRGGLARLQRDGAAGEVGRYESFASDFTQSADTRDYALSMALTPEGGFLIAKGGQQVDHRSRSAGRVLEVSADGREVSVFATGLRNAYLAVHPGTGLVTASDQQGHWVPATPVHVLTRGDYFGFVPSAPVGIAQPPVREPPLWLPHRIAQSGIDQVWITDDRLGPSLEGSLLYLDYHRPGIVKVLLDPRGAPQAAALQLPTAFSVPLLKGEVNPKDGQLYLVGFRVWDSNADEIAGFCRLRYTGAGTALLPAVVSIHREGVLLRFPFPLDPARGADAGSYEVRSWSYRRTGEYGSAHYRSDGELGSDPLLVHSAILSGDGHGVFLALPELGLADQVEVRYALAGGSGRAVESAAYLTARQLPSFRPRRHGFEPIDFPALFAESPAPRRPRPTAEAASRERGELLFTTMGCAACHSLDGTTEGKTGPTLAGVSGSSRRLIGGGEARATSDYLREAILEPAARVVEGFDPRDVGMPPYRGILSDDDVTSLVMFIDALSHDAPAGAPTR